MNPLARFNEAILHSPDDGGDGAPIIDTPAVDTPDVGITSDAPQVSVDPDAQAATDDLGLIADANAAILDNYEPFKGMDGEEASEEEQAMLSELAKEAGLSQVEASKAVDFASRLIDKMAEQMNKQAQEEQAAERAKFAEAWKASDKDGVKTIQANEAFKKLPQEHQDALKQSGLLHNNIVVSLLAENGRLTREGRSISGKPAQQQSVMYNNTPELYS